MKRILKYKEYCNNNNYKETESIEYFESHLEKDYSDDRALFTTFMSIIYENYLNVDEINEIKRRTLITESIWGDLYDKAKRNVLKVVNKAHDIFTEMAEKAGKLVDFVKKLSESFVGMFTKQLKSTPELIKKSIINKAPVFIKIVSEWLSSKKPKFIKDGVTGAARLYKFIYADFPIRLANKISSLFTTVFKKEGTNEGLQSLDIYLITEDREEKKSFLERMKEKILSYPPFSFFPKVTDLANKGLDYIGKILDKFFGWVDSKTEIKNEAVNLERPYSSSKFGKGIKFLIVIGSLYLMYNLSVVKSKKNDEFKNKILSSTEVDDIASEYKNKTIDYFLDITGIGSISSFLSSAFSKIIDTATDWVDITLTGGATKETLKTLTTIIGTYLALKPQFDRAFT